MGSGRFRGKDIRGGLVGARLAADPFGGGMEVVVTVGGKTIPAGRGGCRFGQSRV